MRDLIEITKQVSLELRKKKWKLAIAESITGGSISKKITDASPSYVIFHFQYCELLLQYALL